MNTTVIPSSQGENPNPTGEELTTTTTSSEVIKVCSPFFDGIPLELQQIPQWVFWFNNTTYCARGKKEPKHPRGDYTASAANPENWMEFGYARTKFQTRRNVSGVGLALTKGIKVTVVDIDECIDFKNNVISEFGLDILNRFNNETYVEVSVHMDGLHIVCYGNLPEGEKCGGRSNGDGSIEIYDSLRYITFNGHKLKAANAHITRKDDVIAQLCEEFPKTKETDECERKERIVRNGSSLPDLQCMDFCAPYNSHIKDGKVVGCNPTPDHENTSGTAFVVDPSTNTWHCWFHQCGGGAYDLYAITKGIIDCKDVKRGCLEGKWREIIVELKKDGYTIPEDPIFKQRADLSELLKNLGVLS